jgi:hypothetical protein
VSPFARLLLALVAGLPSPGAPPEELTQAKIDAAIDKGVRRVLQQFADGFGRRDPTGRSGPEIVDHPGLRALAAYTLVKSGVPAEHPVVEQLLARIAFERVDKTYDRALLLLLLQAAHPVAQRDWIEQLASEVVASQAEAGDWGYPEGGDLSNTQYAALGLRAAVQAGCTVPAETWKRLGRALLEYRTSDGGFAYVDSSTESTGSMTVAGIGTLALCESELARAGALEPDLELPMRAARAAGIAWIEKHFAVDHNPRNGGWVHYYLYGMERVGALSGVERFGAHDWYREGATHLLATQGGDGEWPSTFEREGTLFALLFLRRATSVHASPRTAAPGEKEVPVVLPVASGPIWLRIESERPLRLALDGFAATERARLAWPGEGGPRVLRVEYLAGESVLAVAVGDPSRAVATERFAREVELPPGKHALRARVHFLPPPREKGAKGAQPGPAVAVESRALDFEVAPPSGGAAAAAPPTGRLDPANLLQPGGCKASASTIVAKLAGFEFAALEPARAADGNPRTPWVARTGDREPTLKLTLRKPQRADRVRIHPPRLVPRTPATLVAPREARVLVNGTDAGRAKATVPGSVLELRFAAPRLVSALELRFSAAGDANETLGVGEVELLLDG